MKNNNGKKNALTELKQGIVERLTPAQQAIMRRVQQKKRADVFQDNWYEYVDYNDYGDYNDLSGSYYDAE